MGCEIEAYTRRKLALINEREDTNHGEEYYQILHQEVAAQFMYSEMTFAMARNQGGEKVANAAVDIC